MSIADITSPFSIKNPTGLSTHPLLSYHLTNSGPPILHSTNIPQSTILETTFLLSPFTQRSQSSNHSEQTLRLTQSPFSLANRTRRSDLPSLTRRWESMRATTCKCRPTHPRLLRMRTSAAPCRKSMSNWPSLARCSPSTDYTSVSRQGMGIADVIRLMRAYAMVNAMCCRDIYIFKDVKVDDGVEGDTLKGLSG